MLAFGLRLFVFFSRVLKQIQENLQKADWEKRKG